MTTTRRSWRREFAALIGLTCVMHIGFAAEIIGQVEGARDLPVWKAVVSAHQIELRPGEAVHSYRTRTGSDGTFRLENIPPGSYTICVATPQQDYLDPCVWPPSVGKVELTQDEATDRISIVLKTGKRIRLRLDDPERKIPTRAHPERDGIVHPVVVTRKGYACPFGRVSSDRDGHNYETVVPFDEEVYITFDTHNVRVVRPNGVTVRSLEKRPVISRRGAPDEVLRYRIAPKNKKTTKLSE